MRQWHTYTHPSTTPSTHALIQQMVDKYRRDRDKLQWNGVVHGNHQGLDERDKESSMFG